MIERIKELLGSQSQEDVILGIILMSKENLEDSIMIASRYPSIYSHLQNLKVSLNNTIISSGKTYVIAFRTLYFIKKTEESVYRSNSHYPIIYTDEE